MKCDEQTPVCQNCVKSGRKCYRGTRLNFIQYSFYDPKRLLNSPQIKVLDQSITIAGLYNGKAPYNPYLRLHTLEDLKQSDEVYKSDCELSRPATDERRENLIGSLSGTTAAAAAARAAAIAVSDSMGAGSDLSRLGSNLTTTPIRSNIIGSSRISSTRPNSLKPQVSIDNIAAIDREQEEHQPPEPLTVRSDSTTGTGIKIKPDPDDMDSQMSENDIIEKRQYDEPMSVSSDHSHQESDTMVETLNQLGSNQVAETRDDNFEFHLLSRPGTTVDSPFFNEDLINNFQVPNLSTFNIQNFLLKPKYQFEPPNLSNSKIIFDNPNFEFDINQFIKLVDGEKYYWLLDLFNELNIWKSLVPNYCLNLIHTNANSPNNNISHLIKLHQTKHDRPKTTTTTTTTTTATTPVGPISKTTPNISSTPGGETQDLTSPIDSTSTSPPSIVYNQNSDYNHLINNTFLMNCLLNCSVETFNEWANFKFLLKLQLNYFNFVKTLNITSDTFKNFEILLVSIALNLFNILLKSMHNTKFNRLFKIFNNQIKIFNKLIFKFFKLPRNKFEKFKSLIFISSVHSIVILKHLIHRHWAYHQQEETLQEEKEDEAEDTKGSENEKEDDMNIDPPPQKSFGRRPSKVKSRSSKIVKPKLNDLNVYDDNTNIDSVNWNEDLDEPLDYDSLDPTPIRKLNYFEILQLNDDFNGLEINQSSYPINVNVTANEYNSIRGSSAMKLRKLVWHSIKLDYLWHYPNFESFNLNNSVIPQFDDLNLNIILPNDRLTLLLLLSQYLTKATHLLNNDSSVVEKCNGNIGSIFAVIDNSIISEDLKRFWSQNFRWMLA